MLTLLFGLSIPLFSHTQPPIKAMQKRDFSDLLSVAIVAAARAIIEAADSVNDDLSAPPAEPPAEPAAEPPPAEPAVEPPHADAEDDEIPNSDDNEFEEFYNERSERPDPRIAVEGVPLGHPIHEIVRDLLPAFREIAKAVNSADFSVTKRTVETALPVWMDWNSLAKFKNDPYYPEIQSYIRTHIKPICFAALGKSVA